MRRRYRYNRDTGQMEELGADWTDAERRAPVATEALTYDNLQATDGTPINSRTRHRNFMRERGLALAGDYTNTWAKAAAKREDFFAGRHEHKGLREAIGRAVDKVRGRKP